MSLQVKKCFRSHRFLDPVGSRKRSGSPESQSSSMFTYRLNSSYGSVGRSSYQRAGSEGGSVSRILRAVAGGNAPLMDSELPAESQR